MVDAETRELLETARDELCILRAGVAPLRNRAKVAVAVIDDTLHRTEALIDRIDAKLNGSSGHKEAQGHDREAHDKQDRVGQS